MLNTICLVGRIVHDPELKNTNSGNAVTSFAVAVERNRSGQDGEKIVDYIDVVAWRKTAEFVSKYFKKGSWIAVNGSLQTRSYEDRDGKKRKVFEVVADNVHFCGGKESAPSGNTSKLDKFSAYAEANLADFNEVGGEDDLPW